jgi:hypothetical protein
MSAFIKRAKRPQINNIMLHLKLLKKQYPQKSRRREIIKIRATINERSKKPYKESTKQKLVL